MRAGTALVLGLLGFAARSAAAQEAVLLRSDAPAGTVSPYRVQVDAWLTSFTGPADTAAPAVRIVSFVRRTALAADSLTWRFTDATDSSSVATPALAGMPGPTAPGDLLRGLVTETAVSEGGRAVTTRVITMPSLPPELPALLRGLIGVAVSSTRLTTFAAPAGAVRAGDRWSDTVRYRMDPPGPPGAAGLAASGVGRAEFQLVSLLERGGRWVAVIHASTIADAAAGDAGASATAAFTGSGTWELDVAARQLLRADVRVTGTMVTRAGALPLRTRLLMEAR